MPTANFVYNAKEGGVVKVRITDKPLEQDGNLLGHMPIEVDGNVIKDLWVQQLEQVFAWGVSIARRNPRLHIEYPEP